MIPLDELRIGNRVLWNPKFLKSRVALALAPIEITAILPDKIAFISLNLEHRVEPFEDDLVANDKEYEPLEEIEPIPLSEEWLMKLPEGITYPGWIQYVHELQNWYFWNHDKTELPIQE